MIDQGPSKNTNLMEWETIWAINYKKIDKFAPRYTAVTENFVTINVVDTAKEHIFTKMYSLHPKVKEFGEKPFCRGDSLMVEKEDVKDLK